MLRALIIIGIQASPLVLLLMSPLWNPHSSVMSFVLIGLLVSVGFGIVAWSLRTRTTVAMPIGLAVLATPVAVIRVAEEFVYVNLGLVYVLLVFVLIGGMMVTFGIVRFLVKADPVVSLDGDLVKGLGKLVNRLGVPALISWPFAWLLLHLFRGLTYDGDHPNEFHSRLITAEDHIWWPALALLPFAFAITVHWLVSWMQSRKVG
jgi:hypothetical protein